MKNTLFILLTLSLFLVGCDVRDMDTKSTIDQLYILKTTVKKTTMTGKTLTVVGEEKDVVTNEEAVEDQNTQKHHVLFSFDFGDLKVQKTGILSESNFNLLRDQKEFTIRLQFEEDENVGGGSLKIYFNGEKIYSEKLYENSKMFSMVYGNDFIPVSYEHSGPFGYFFWNYVFKYWWVALCLMAVEFFIRVYTSNMDRRWRGGYMGAPGLGIYGCTTYNLLDFKDYLGNRSKEKRVEKINAMDMKEIAKLVDQGKFEANQIKSEMKRKAVEQHLKDHYNCLEEIS